MLQKEAFVDGMGRFNTVLKDSQRYIVFLSEQARRYLDPTLPKRQLKP